MVLTLDINTIFYKKVSFFFPHGRFPKKGRSGGKPPSNPNKENRFNFFKDRKKQQKINEDDKQVENDQKSNNDEI
jgi:hypothetical protein